MTDKQEAQQTLGNFWSKDMRVFHFLTGSIEPVARKYEIIWTTDEENGLLIAVKKGTQNSTASDSPVKIAGFDLVHKQARIHRSCYTM